MIYYVYMIYATYDVWAVWAWVAPNSAQRYLQWHWPARRAKIQSWGREAKQAEQAERMARRKRRKHKAWHVTSRFDTWQVVDLVESWDQKRRKLWKKHEEDWRHWRSYTGRVLVALGKTSEKTCAYLCVCVRALRRKVASRPSIGFVRQDLASFSGFPFTTASPRTTHFSFKLPKVNPCNLFLQHLSSVSKGRLSG